MSRRKPYRPNSYWTALHSRSNIAVVGHDHLSMALNESMYRVAQRNLMAFLRRHNLLDPPPSSVFEAGAGTGFWVDEWLRLGVRRVDGCDLAETAVARLRATNPLSKFDQCDLAAPDRLADGRTYDLVTALNVLLHITSQRGFDIAMGNVATAVESGGHLLIADAALAHRPFALPRQGQSSLARPVEHYCTAAERHGLELVAINASTVVGANPIDIRSGVLLRMAQVIWGGTTRLASQSDGLARALGAGIDQLDRRLMRTGLAPSGKFLLFRRPRTAV